MSRSLMCIISVCLVVVPGAGARAAGGTSALALVNPGFEADGAGVGSPHGWTGVGDEGASFTEGGGHSGRFRLSHWSRDAFAVERTQTITGLDRGWYTLRVWVRRSTGNNHSYVEFGCDQATERVAVPIAWASQWVQVGVSAFVHRGSCTVVLHTDADGGEWTNFDDLELGPGAAQLSVLGADVSSLAKSEDLGGVYFDALRRGHEACRGRESRPGHEPACRDGHHRLQPDAALRILKEHGANFVRLRAWVNSPDGYHDEAELVDMSRRAGAAGLRVLVDLHYSDTWADPEHQAKPAAWAKLDVAQLTSAIYRYTYGVCHAMKRHGVAPAMVQLGNELNAGMLWPDGHTWNPPNWDNLAAFLKAGHKAVKDCSPETKVMLHLANGGDNGLYRWWFDNITTRGVEFDVIGASYYGYWHGSLGDLQANLNDVSARYQKDVIVVETAYPFTLADKDGWENVLRAPSQLVLGYPATPRGRPRTSETCCPSCARSRTGAGSAPSIGMPRGPPCRAMAGIPPIRRRATRGRTRLCSTSMGVRFRR